MNISALSRYDVKISWFRDNKNRSANVEIECAEDATDQQRNYLALEALNKNRRVPVFEAEVFEYIYTPRGEMSVRCCTATLSTEYFPQALNGWGAYKATLIDDETGEEVFVVKRRDQQVAVDEATTWAKTNNLQLNDLTGLSAIPIAIDPM